jgi:hypothetical protein
MVQNEWRLAMLIPRSDNERLILCAGFGLLGAFMTIVIRTLHDDGVITGLGSANVVYVMTFFLLVLTGMALLGIISISARKWLHIERKQ